MLDSNEIAQVQQIIRSQLKYPTDPITQRTLKDLFNSFFPEISASAPGTNATIAASNTPTIIPLATATILNGIFQSSGAGFKIAVAGNYLAFGVAYFNSPGAATVRTLIVVNGAVILTSFDTLSGSGITSNKNVIGLLQLNSGDNVQLYGETSSGSTINVLGTGCYLTLIKI